MERLSDLTSQMREKQIGRLSGRYFKALFHAHKHGDHGYAERQRWVEASVIKSAIPAAGTSDATFYPVAQDLQLLVAKISGMRKLQGFRNVPDNVNCISQASGSQAYWGAEGAATPLSALALVRSALVGQRVNSMSVVTAELADASDSENVIAADHARSIGEKLDATFFDPQNAGSPEIQPRSITHDSPRFTSSGSAVANVDADLRLLVASMSSGGSNLLNAVWVMNPITGATLGSLRGSGGSPSYPGMGALGGTLLGLPAICTAGIARSGSPSPGTSYLCLVDASRIWLTDSGITFRASKYATLEMSDTPSGSSTTPTAASTVSMFQTDSVALLSTAWMNWRAVTNASAAAVLLNVEY